MHFNNIFSKIVNISSFFNKISFYCNLYIQAKYLFAEKSSLLLYFILYTINLFNSLISSSTGVFLFKIFYKNFFANIITFNSTFKSLGIENKFYFIS